MEDYCALLLKIPQNNPVKEDGASDFFYQLAEIFKNRKITISAEIIIYNKFLWFILICPKSVKDVIKGQWYSRYPQADIEEIKDFTAGLLTDYSFTNFAGCELHLDQSELLPIKTYKSLEKNPLVSLSGLINSFGDKEFGIIQVVMQSARNESFFEKLVKKISSSTKEQNMPSAGKNPAYIKLEEIKEEQPYFKTSIRILASAKTRQKSLLNLSSMLAVYKKNLELPNIQKLKDGPIKTDSRFIAHFIKRLLGRYQFRFSPEEIATIFHAPYKDEGISQLAQSKTKRSAPPQNLPNQDGQNPEDVAFFAQTNFQNEKVVFGLKTGDRRRHVYVVGKTGMGKSKLIELLIKSDLENNRGVILLDPHGDLSQEILTLIPDKRKNDVVYFNPADSEYPIGFNPLEGVSTFEFKQIVVSGFISIFKKLFGFNWNERLEHVLRYTTLALLDYPASNVLGITRMLTDNEFRQEVIKHIKDPLIKKFWTTEFASWNEQFAQQAIVPIINNVGQFVANPIIRNIVGQSKSGFSLDKILNQEKIFIANLSIGKLGEENSALLGSMLITKIWQTAMARSSKTEENRKDTFMYVDEFQNFATSAFTNIFSEARKYRLDLTVSHQYMQQLPEEVRSTIFGNVGSIISFRVGGEDAQILAKEFDPVFTTSDFLNLDIRNLYIKMSIDGTTARPFSATTLPLEKADKNYRQEIIALSRKQFATAKKSAEAEIEMWEKGDVKINKKGANKTSGSFPEPIV